MTSRIFMFIVGALAVGALMFGIPTVAAQNGPGSPGNCPFGGVCPMGRRWRSAQAAACRCRGAMAD